MVVAFVQAVIALGLAFGLSLTDTQMASIIAVISLGIGLLTRRQIAAVTPVRTP